MYSYTEENYLKAVYKLSEAAEEAINTNSIAEVLRTKAASVTDMIKKLSDKKLLKYEKYRGVTLTEKGRKVAVEIVRKHRLWEVFLHEKLKFGWDEVHDIAEQLEHIQSAALTDKLEEFLDFPSHDPHGDPIPTKQGEIKKSNFIVLSTLELKQKAHMCGVAEHSPLFLKHLDKIGFTIGSECEIEEVNGFDGSIRLRIEDKKEVFISKEIARNILVKVK